MIAMQVMAKECAHKVPATVSLVGGTQKSILSLKEAEERTAVLSLAPTPVHRMESAFLLNPLVIIALVILDGPAFIAKNKNVIKDTTPQPLASLPSLLTCV